MATEDFVEVPIDEVEKSAIQVTQPDEVVVEKVDKPADKTIIEPDEGVRLLKENLKKETDARLAAELQAQESQRQAVQARNEVQDTNIHLVKNAMDALQSKSEILKQRYREARLNGDVEEEIKVQEEMQVNSNKIFQLEQGKKALEAKPKESVVDPVEAFAKDLTPRSAAWVRKNPDYVKNPVMNQKMLAAHSLAIADGHVADSDSYFQAIEETLKIKKADPALQENANDVTAQVTQRRQSAPAAAPVSRSGTADGSRPNVVRLTSAEVEMAEMMGMTPVEYARNKRALEKEGKLNGN